MPGDHLDPPGELVDPSRLTASKARELARLLETGKIEYARLVECRARSASDVVVFDVEVELGQLQVYDIRSNERIAAEFFASDDIAPEVLALRSDFPQVPHLNLRTEEFPRSLCLYNQPYRELKRQWTPARFVERVRTWLALTAKGKLHGDDQPLEPLLLSHAGRIVLPRTFHGPEQNSELELLFVTATSLASRDSFYIASYRSPAQPEQGVPFAGCVLRCAPQQHGVIRQLPGNLDQLAQLVRPAGLDILPVLRTRIEHCKGSLDVELQKHFLNSPLMFVVAFPKTRTPDGPVESTDVWVFLTLNTVREVGIDIGLWTEVDGELGHALEPPEEQTGTNVQIDVLDPVYEFTPQWAAVLNGITPSVEPPAIAAIGAGALGSQVTVNVARVGFGTWTVIDEDRLLPHNLARHALGGDAVGFPKAQAVAHLANSLTPASERFSPIVANVLRPGDKASELSEALRHADMILDMSASVAVARYLARDAESPARRVSLFLNPAGTDLVILAEDADRMFPLDALEMQFYRALVSNEELAGHFEPPDDRQRYGQSCRDVTVTISHDLIALHSAIAARTVRDCADQKAARITAWRASSDGTVCRVDIEPTHITTSTLGEWTVCIDTFVLQRMQSQRSEKLPNETGGVLLGSFDLERRVAYVIDTIPSPPDSEEWPTLYIRGSHGLKHRVEDIVATTDGTLHYVGEWHSHPNGCSTAPSDDDMQVFSWLTDLMSTDGFPALMMIAGQDGATSFFIGTMEHRENLVPTV